MRIKCKQHLKTLIRVRDKDLTADMVTFNTYASSNKNFKYS